MDLMDPNVSLLILFLAVQPSGRDIFVLFVSCVVCHFKNRKKLYNQTAAQHEINGEYDVRGLTNIFI